MSYAADATVTPVELDLERGAALRIRWADGHESRYPLVLLRRACPCAACRAEREARQRNPLHVLPTVASPQDMVTAAQAEIVGNYAFRVRWKDGHDTGIYDFKLLRRLCPCAACASADAARA